MRNTSFATITTTMIHETKFGVRYAISTAAILVIATLTITWTCPAVYAKLAKPLPETCLKRIQCEFTSEPGDYLTLDDVRDFPLLKELTDLQTNSTLMNKYYANDYKQANMTVRKVYNNDKVYLFKTFSFYDFKKDDLYPKLEPLPESNDAKTLQECLERHCTSAKNPAILECQSAQLPDWEFQYVKNVTQECINRITYVDFRNTHFKSMEHTSNYFTNVTHVNLLYIAIDLFEHMHLKSYFAKIRVLDFDDVIDERIFTQLIFAPNSLIEINAPDATYWLPSRFKIEKYEPNRQYISFGETNRERNKIIYDKSEFINEENNIGEASALTNKRHSQIEYKDNTLNITAESNTTNFKKANSTKPQAPKDKNQKTLTIVLFLISFSIFIIIIIILVRSKMQLPNFKS